MTYSTTNFPSEIEVAQAVQAYLERDPNTWEELSKYFKVRYLVHKGEVVTIYEEDSEWKATKEFKEYWVVEIYLLRRNEQDWVPTSVLTNLVFRVENGQVSSMADEPGVRYQRGKYGDLQSFLSEILSFQYIMKKQPRLQ